MSSSLIWGWSSARSDSPTINRSRASRSALDLEAAEHAETLRLLAERADFLKLLGSY
jgi:hypothetical protein